MIEAALQPVHATRVEFNVADGVPTDLVHVAADAGEHGHRHREFETVRLQNDALARRVLRLRTDTGREVSMRLPPGGPPLRPGDVIAVTPTSFVVVQTSSTPVIVVRPESVRQMGEVAHALGNRHRQVQFFDADSPFGQVVFLTPADHTVADYLRSVGVPFTSEDVTLDVPFRHSEHTH